MSRTKRNYYLGFENNYALLIAKLPKNMEFRFQIMHCSLHILNAQGQLLRGFMLYGVTGYYYIDGRDFDNWIKFMGYE